MEQDILEYAAKMHCRELHMSVDLATGLKAVIAVHSTALGPALGGCRLFEYASTTAAAIDAIRLAQGMTYKAAISNLPLGGGKMVILKPKQISDRVAFFKAVGRTVNLLSGRYITAVDIGTSVEDMDIVATTSKFVTCTSTGLFTIADPSALTARGVLRSIQAAVKFKLGKNTLERLHVTIQGLGHAGYHLAKELHESGARLTVFDVKPELVQKCVKEFSAMVAPDFNTLLSLKADVFAPCALGAILNDDTIPRIRAPIVAGCANNQLAEPRHGRELMDRGILYAPDYAINAGGLIYVSGQHTRSTEAETKQNIENIYNTSLEIFERAEREKRSTNEIADIIAQERVKKKSESLEQVF